MVPRSRKRRQRLLLGLGVCLLAALPWVLSAVKGVQLLTAAGNGVNFFRGGLIITWGSPLIELGCPWRGGFNIHDRPTGEFEWNLYPMWGQWGVEVPGWYPVLLPAFLTLVLWLTGLRRARPGRCAECGYDLTGNVSGRCPECGTGTGLQPSPERA